MIKKFEHGSFQKLEVDYVMVITAIARNKISLLQHCSNLLVLYACWLPKGMKCTHVVSISFINKKLKYIGILTRNTSRLFRELYLMHVAVGTFQ